MSNPTSIEEMEAAFGPVPEGFGTLEGFANELLDNPVSRNLGTLGEDFGERTDRIARIANDPNRNLGNKAAGVVAQTAGYASDLVGGLAGTVLDAVVPGTPARAIVEELVQIEDVQELIQKYEGLPQETKDDLSSMGVVLEAFPLVRAGRMFNVSAANSSSQVSDFYSGNPLARFLGVGQSFGTRGLTAATQQALTAQGQALLRNGVPQGMVKEIQALSSAASLLDGIRKKVARAEERKKLIKEGKAKPEDFQTDEWVLTGEERQALKRAQDAGKGLKDKEGNNIRELASDTTLLSYLEAEVLKSYNILKQSGHEAPILDALSKPLTSYVGSMADTGEIKKHLDPKGAMPDGVYSRIMEDVNTAHTKANPTTLQKLNPRTNATPENSIAVIRNTKGQSGIAGEGAGQKGTPYGRLYASYDDYVKNTNRPEVAELKRTQKSLETQENNIAKRGDKGPTPAQTRKLNELKAKEAELAEDVRINGAIASSKKVVGGLAKNFPEGPADAKTVVDYLRASKLKSSDAATYAKLMDLKRKGGTSVLTDAQRKRYEALLAKKEKKPLARGDRNALADLQDRIDNGQLGPQQEESLARIETLLRGQDNWTGRSQPNRLRVVGQKDEQGDPVMDADGYPVPDENGFIYFVDSHHSSEKVLGGVRSTTAFNPETGETFVVISDGHDIFSLNPAGGKGLVTIVEPFRWNAYEKTKTGKMETLGEGPRGSYEQAVDDLYNMTGIKPSGNNPGQKLTGLMTDFAQQYRPTPTAGDRLRAANNQLQGGVATGMLAPNIYSSNEEEPTQ